MMLGDLSINKKIKGNGCFQMTHSTNQEEYLDFKKKILEFHPKVKMTKSYRKTYLKSTEKTYEQVYCYSNNNKYATFLHKVMYKNGKKIVNRKILNQLSDFGLYLWYLDDGYLNIRYDEKTKKIKEYRIFLYTNSFSLDEVKEIKKWFNDRYGIDPNINKKGNGYILYFNSSKTREFMKIIDKFYDLVPSMQRKFLKYHIPS